MLHQVVAPLLGATLLGAVAHQQAVSPFKGQRIGAMQGASGQRAGLRHGGALRVDQAQLAPTQCDGKVALCVCRQGGNGRLKAAHLYGLLAV